MYKKLWRSAILSGVVFTLAACSTDRPFMYDLPFRSKNHGESGSRARAIALPAQKRMVIAKSFGAYCAEPSPDALSALASSIGIDVNNNSGTTGNGSFALNEAVASFGLRTQSIQLMRDSLYRVCESYYNKALNSFQVHDLHQRSQDNMVAILAIEQLTGAITGAQSVSAGQALGISARTGSVSKEDLAEAIADFQTKDVERKNTDEELKKNQAILKTQQDKLKKVDEEINTLKEEIDTATKSAEGITEEEKKDEKNAFLETAEKKKGELTAKNAEKDVILKAISSLELTIAEIEKTLIEKTKEADVAKQFLELQKENYGKSSTSTGAATSTAGAVSLNQEIAKNITNVGTNVQTIVTSLLNKPRPADSCMKMLLNMTNPAYNAARLNEYQKNKIIKLCEDVIRGKKLSSEDFSVNMKIHPADATSKSLLEDMPRQKRVDFQGMAVTVPK